MSLLTWRWCSNMNLGKSLLDYEVVRFRGRGRERGMFEAVNTQEKSSSFLAMNLMVVHSMKFIVYEPQWSNACWIKTSGRNTALNLFEIRKKRKWVCVFSKQPLNKNDDPLPANSCCSGKSTRLDRLPVDFWNRKWRSTDFGSEDRKWLANVWRTNKSKSIELVWFCVDTCLLAF